MAKVCTECGREYAPTGNRQLRCTACRFRGAPRPGTSFGTRLCAFCGRPFEAKMWHARFCTPEHRWKANRPVRAARYENARHRAERRRLAPIVAAGLTPCARCGELIAAGAPWDLDHAPDGVSYLGPSHAACNRATSAHAKARRQGRELVPAGSSWVSRSW